MIFVIIFLLLSFLVISCNDGPQKPDVSNINVELTLRRFDQEFFKTDTLNLTSSLTILEKKYPFFYVDFIEKMLSKRSDMDKSQIREVMEGIKSKVQEDMSNSNYKPANTIFSRVNYK